MVQRITIHGPDLTEEIIDWLNEHGYSVISREDLSVFEPLPPAPVTSDQRCYFPGDAKLGATQLVTLLLDRTYDLIVLTARFDGEEVVIRREGGMIYAVHGRAERYAIGIFTLPAFIKAIRNMHSSTRVRVRNLLAPSDDQVDLSHRDYWLGGLTYVEVAQVINWQWQDPNSCERHTSLRV